MIDVMAIKLGDRIRRKKLHSDLPPNIHCLLYKASIVQNLCVYNQTSRNGVATYTADRTNITVLNMRGISEKVRWYFYNTR